MTKQQLQVSKFNSEIAMISKYDTDLLAGNEEEGLDYRDKLVKEETFELLSANNLDEKVDALCDLLYVVYGYADYLGIDIEPFFDEVHRTNMEKEGGPFREDGKILKPPGWRPPAIGDIFNNKALWNPATWESRWLAQFDNEDFAMAVRDTWADHAGQLPNAPPAWTKPWSELGDFTKDADRKIAATLIEKVRVVLFGK